ncbi:MAG: hypothetical protein AMXMBFR84_05660 [Candidatus Hydrogenedentota bacterium]
MGESVRVSMCAIALFLSAVSMAGEPPLRIDANGVLLRDGQPYRAIGVNYYDVFLRRLQDSENTTYRDGFKTLAENQIPFVRFNGGGFWPVEWKQYQADPAGWWASLDDVVKAAEESGIGLIPSVFWLTSTIPDLVGEPRNQWGNPESKTIGFMRDYMSALVQRYKESPAIWAWELGNEYDLAMDLPNAPDTRPWVNEALGTPASRSEADDLTSDMIRVATMEFAKVVRQHDPIRPVTSGHSLPRPSAYHLRTERSWKKDSREQFRESLLLTAPDPIDLVSVHMYVFDSTTRFEQPYTPYEETLRLAVEAVATAKKALFLGEFGASHAEKDGGPDVAKREVLAQVTAIERSGVPLAAAWTFDFLPQEEDYSITLDNNRAYILKTIAQANRRMALRVAGEHHVDVAGSTWTGTIWNNEGNKERSGSAFNPLYHAAYPGRNLFRDDFVGLNFEHIFNGTAKDKDISMFTPRKDACLITVHGPDDVTITWKAEESAWAMDCAMRYTLIENGVDMTFTCSPREPRYPLGYAALMWASYMNHTRDRTIHFPGKNGDVDGWVTFGEPTGDSETPGFETGTVSHAGVPDLPYEDGAQTLNLIEHPTKKFTDPFYYGLVDGDGDKATDNDTMAYVMMFDQREPIRFALWNFIKSANGEPNPHSPAWDWQFVVREPELGKTYGYRARMMYVPFESADAIAAKFADWQSGLP